jgi:hypothetical protein
MVEECKGGEMRTAADFIFVKQAHVANELAVSHEPW